MPSLKGLTCSIELAQTKKPLQEYGTIYNDGFVETFVAVPSKSKPFTVHLTSSDIIAEGLAMYVFIDGIYQCNRNRQNLKHDPLDPRSFVDFRVRQKEEKQADGTMIAREWVFEKLNIDSADSAPDTCSFDILDNIGCIEVILLRCAGSRNSTSSSDRGKSSKLAQSSAFGLDGANDLPDHHFGLDGQPRDWETPWNWASFDTYGRQTTDGFAKSQKPGRDPGGTRKLGLQSQLPSRPSSSYAKTIWSHNNSIAGDDSHSHLNNRDSSPSIIERLHARSYKGNKRAVSPGYAGNRHMSSVGYRYGTGPVPHGKESETELFENRTPGSIFTTTPVIDHPWLDRYIADAVQRGVEEKLGKGTVPRNDDKLIPETPFPPPGAWPISPFGPTEQLPNAIEGRKPEHQRKPSRIEPSTSNHSRGISWGIPSAIWGKNSAKTNEGTDTWKSLEAQGVVDPPNWTSAHGNTSDSWESSTWGTRDNSSTLQQGKSKPSPWSKRVLMGSRPASISSFSTRRSEDGWVNVESQSDKSSTYWSTKSDVTVVPESVTVGKAKNSQSGSNIFQTSGWTSPNTSSTWNTQKDTGWSDANEGKVFSGSSTWDIIAPVNPPPPQSIAARRQSRRTEREKKEETSIPPAPTWGCAVPHKSQNYMGTPIDAPSPYGITLETLIRKISSGSCSTSPWNAAKNEDSSPSWGIEGQTDCWASNRKVEDQSLWVGTNDNNTTFNSWNSHNSSSKEQGKSRNAADGSSFWNNDSWGAKESKNENKHSNYRKERMPGGWGEDSNDVKSQDLGNSAWEVSSWDNKGELNDQDHQGNAWDNPDNGPDNKVSNEHNHSSTGGEAWQTEAGGWNNTSDTPNGTSKGGEAWNNDGDAWNIPDLNDQPHGTPWGGNDVFSTPYKASRDKHSTTSSNKNNSYPRSQKYERLRTPSGPGPKEHWTFPPPPSKKELRYIPEECASLTSGGDRKVWTVPEEPLHVVPASKAEEELLEHQVRAGKGTLYTHIVGRPKYIDSLEKPVSPPSS
ncbi:hypothetical protein K505DRAFT_78570 [Melanomma pulvis-pyrius CBS 109.77]|uniref:DUF7918 domain-containing protein n=1 Tax=Melanomma pulvis-pyrius CBS 109.77 TaxID=1314802 RepID=A0A6A6XU98_9PLEO|nr:hypothetical protein K505DRAFT_78570 [Melanomma pulvis-pyrius CBS 109.77]